MSYGNQQQRQPRKPCSGRVWPAKKRSSPNSPHFTGEIALPDGHLMRVSMWESTDRQGTFNGFSFTISEDTRQQGGYQAQGQQGQPQGYGQRPQGGYAPQVQQNGGQQGYPAPGTYNSNGYQGGPQQPYPPVEAYNEGDGGYIPGFDG
jgi:hypothetical protein